ncbi:MAG TPA: ribosomal L7Ae/L30e/S12e/Gadd45 family protein [Bacillota bacterium]|jgi:large subunit ribosomal protein L7A
MPLEQLRQARTRTIGTKQTLKAIQKGQAKVVFVAGDADEKVIREVVRGCEEKAIPVVRAESMAALGKACGIEVGAASAAIVGE